MTEPTLHPDVAPLAWLLGTWAGEGEGWYPTIERFTYGEEIAFAHVGKPFLGYRQRTWALADGRPLHAESGYWRVGARTGSGWRVELVLAHPTGVAEIEEGSMTSEDGIHRIQLESTGVLTSGTAKKVTVLARRFTSSGDDLSYELDMGAMGLALQGHLRARLTMAR